MLTVDPAARITSDAICKHAYVTRAAEILGVNVATKRWSEPSALPHVLDQLAELGLEPQAVSAAVGERQRNELFTAYFLMERRVPHEPEEHADRSMTAPAAPQAELGGTSPRGQIGTVDEGAAVGASA
eukprot:4323023-Prymnesium_polylepis.1